MTRDRVNKYSKRGMFKLGDGYDFYMIDFKASKNLYVFEDHYLEHMDNHSIIITRPKKIHTSIINIP
jgi:hypothetical protein